MCVCLCDGPVSFGDEEGPPPASQSTTVRDGHSTLTRFFFFCPSWSNASPSCLSLSPSHSCSRSRPRGVPVRCRGYHAAFAFPRSTSRWSFFGACRDDWFGETGGAAGKVKEVGPVTPEALRARSIVEVFSAPLPPAPSATRPRLACSHHHGPLFSLYPIPPFFPTACRPSCRPSHVSSSAASVPGCRTLFSSRSSPCALTSHAFFLPSCHLPVARAHACSRAHSPSLPPISRLCDEWLGCLPSRTALTARGCGVGTAGRA